MRELQSLHVSYALSWQDRSFIRTFLRAINSLSSEEKRFVLRRFIELFNAEAQHITDRAGQSHHIMCALVLAAYESLIRKMDKEQAITALAEALKQHGGKLMRWGMRVVMLVFRGKRLRNFIENISLRRSQDAYGEAFLIEGERQRNLYTSVVKRCGYFDFFQRNGVPE